jgi:D-alanine transaminase
VAEPLPICYLNGTYVPLREARISPLDRGFLYSDGAYELMPVYGGRPFRFGDHCARLVRSLRELRMDDPMSASEWREMIATLIERNASHPAQQRPERSSVTGAGNVDELSRPADGHGDTYIYWQVTRGAEWGRNHAPLPKVPRTVFAFCAPFPATPPAVLEHGLTCITTADTRWSRCDIKSVSLLANVLLRQLAVDAGASETILLRNGELTEASSAAVHVVIDGVLRTPPRTERVLPGTTRTLLEELAERIGLRHESIRVAEEELRDAAEIWLSAATREVAPVTRLDGRLVGNGAPGRLWRRMYDELQRYKQELARQPW